MRHFPRIYGDVQVIRSCTADWQFTRSKAGKQHLNTGFSAGRINRLGLSVYVNPTQVRRCSYITFHVPDKQAKRLRRLLPYD